MDFEPSFSYLQRNKNKTRHFSTFLSIKYSSHLDQKYTFMFPLFIQLNFSNFIIIYKHNIRISPSLFILLMPLLILVTVQAAYVYTYCKFIWLLNTDLRQCYNSYTFCWCGVAGIHILLLSTDDLGEFCACVRAFLVNNIKFFQYSAIGTI